MPGSRKSIKRLPLWATNSTKPFYRSKLSYISMASGFSLALILSLVLFFTLSSASRHRSTHSPPLSSSASDLPPAARDACKVSADPPACEAALAATGQVPTNPTAVQIIQSAMRVSSENLKQAESMVKSILAESSDNKNRSDAAKTCLELYGYVERRMESVGDALTSGKIKDARAWMSAALVYHYDCWSALKYVNNTARVNSTMAFTNSLIGLTSNALGMLVNYDRNGKETGSWGPVKTERDGFWEGAASSGSGINGGVPAGLTPDVTVCPDGVSCKYKKVQDAVNVAPNFSNRKFVILIKAGVYDEIVRVPFEKTNVVFLGEGMGKTVITGSLNVGMLGVSTFNSATVGVVGDGFMASGVTFQNKAGPDAHQAVAFRSDSDLSIVENCEFLGNQDTLYAHSLRQYYKSCRIQGNVDFIFGNSAAFFQDCTILVAPRQVNPEKGENNAVTAHGRIDPGQSTGFVFQNCVVNGTEDYMKLYFSKPKAHKNYLGRPWKEYSRTVFIKCTLEALISPSGWMPWSGDFALKTLYYGEFENSGAGATTSGRVGWSSQIPAEHVSSYSVDNFIQGGQWIPTSS